MVLQMTHWGYAVVLQYTCCLSQMTVFCFYLPCLPYPCCCLLSTDPTSWLFKAGCLFTGQQAHQLPYCLPLPSTKFPDSPNYITFNHRLGFAMRFFLIRGQEQ